MAVKAICFCRVSSDKQSYDRQKSDLIPMMKSDGYKDDEISIINHKESATKNNVQNRKSISELKELIANNPIESVYICEISRLARRNDVLYSVLALLEEKKICLIVKSPMEIRTIVNGEPNPIAHVIIAFMSHLAVSESIIKVERQKSGYNQKVKDGKVVSSKVKFGYKRVNGYAQIDHQCAKIVNEIYELYLNDMSVTSIWDYYKHSGVFPNIPNKSGWSKITYILRDKTYIGENEYFNYPKLIDIDLFNAVQVKMDNNKLVKSNLMNVYYCQGLVKIDGHTMTPNASQCTYTYRDCNTLKTCGISINVIDSLALNLACVALSSMMQTTNQQRRENAAERLEMAKNKALGIVGSIKDNEKEQDRLNYVFTKGKMSEDKYLFEMERLEGELNHLLKEQEELNVLCNQLENVITKTSDSMQQSKDYNALMSVDDDNERKRMVRDAIDSINLTKIEKGYEIRFDYKDKSLNDDVYYLYKQSGPKINLYAVYDDVYEDYTGCWENRVKSLYKRKKDGLN